jgi:hypothetical protein
VTSKQINARRKQQKKAARLKAKQHESMKNAKKATKLKLQAIDRLPKCVEI